MRLRVSSTNRIVKSAEKTGFKFTMNDGRKATLYSLGNPAITEVFQAIRQFMDTSESAVPNQKETAVIKVLANEKAIYLIYPYYDPPLNFKELTDVENAVESIMANREEKLFREASYLFYRGQIYDLLTALSVGGDPSAFLILDAAKKNMDPEITALLKREITNSKP